MRSALLTLAFLSATLSAEPTPVPEIRDLLRDGLYAEEVSRDPEAAAKDYAQILARAEADQPFIANALFRLAELRRKQDRKDEAITLYQRLLTRYPDADPQAKLSREALATLGTPASGNAEPDEESKDLERLRKLARTSPDLLNKPETLNEALKKGYVRPVAFILDQGNPNDLGRIGIALNTASTLGHLSLVKMLLGRGLDINRSGYSAINAAARAGNLEVAKALLEAGVNPDGKYREIPPGSETPLLIAANRGDMELARLLIEKKADVNLMPTTGIAWHRPGAPVYQIFSGIGAPLHEAAYFGRNEMMDLFLEHGADVNLASPTTKATPLWYAVWRQSQSNPGIVKTLLDHGADPDTASIDVANSEQGYPGKSTVLERAILSRSVSVVKMILEAKRERKTPVNPINLYDALNGQDSLEIVRLLLDYGADPNPEPLLSKSLLQQAAGTPRGWSGEDDPTKWDIIKLLMARGTRIDPGWEKADFIGASAPIRSKLREISYLKQADPKSITASYLDPSGTSKHTVIATCEHTDQSPPDLKSLLAGKIKELTPGYDMKLKLYRKSGTEMSEQEIQVADEPHFPILQWGDIIGVENTGKVIPSAIIVPGN